MINPAPVHSPVRASVACAIGLFLVAIVLPTIAVGAAAAAPVFLWPNGAPGAAAAEADRAAITPFLSTQHPNGAAVLIVPAAGDGKNPAASDASQMTRWLNERGLTAFVLRRRATSGDAAATVAEVNRAVQYLRAHAADFKISARRVAVLGLGEGADQAADAVYNHPLEAKADAADPVEKFSSRPDLLGLIWGAAVPATVPANAPTTFLVGSTAAGDGLSRTIDLWTKLRAARISVDAHFFAKSDLKTVLATNNPSVGSWPEMFYAWARFSGLLTDETRLPIKGLVYLDGYVLPHGYVIFTPLDFVGSGPVVGRVVNSTANQPIGLFSLPADQGPIAGRYRVEVRQNMTRWLSNSFSGDLVGGRGPATPEKAYFGHHRPLSPSIEDQRTFTKVHPSDKTVYVVEFKPGADANMNLKIEVFSR